MKQSGDPYLAKHFAALNDAALLDALARRNEYTEAALDVAREEASRRGLHLPESKRPWVATPAPPTARSPVITGWSIAIALTYFLVFFELARLVERPRLWGWVGWVMVEVAILAASAVAAVVGLTFPRVRHLAVGVLLGILLSYPACIGGRLAVTKYYPRLKVTQILTFALLLTAVAFLPALPHPVGMTVHDVGNYKNRPLQPGMVFAPDPMLWVLEERLYVRMEDTVAVTESGVDNLSGPFVPSELDEIAALVARGDGIVQKRPPLPLP